MIEILIRLYRVLSEEDKNRFKEQFAPYIKEDSSHFMMQVKKSNADNLLSRLGLTYYYLHQNLESAYKDNEIFQIFDRAYQEHFRIIDEQVEVILPEDIGSDTLQSPDDVDATYRKKREETSQGYSINVVETANPDNEIQLITDVSVHSNNTDDSEILNERISVLKEKTPDLAELHTDGGYGSKENDEKTEALGIVHVQTAIKGRNPVVPIEIEKISDKRYSVSCPQQKVESEPTKTRYKVCFDLVVCQVCEFADECPAIVGKKYRTFYFTNVDYLRNKRHHNILKIPKERRKLRPNVEATIRQFTVHLSGKKLKIRGAFKAASYAYNRAIGINFGRIYRMIMRGRENTPNFYLFYLLCMKLSKNS